MSEVIITAAAWVRDEPKVTQFQAEQATVSWRILAEASVTDTAGEPVSKVQKSAWRLHVTDSSGNTYPLGFSVSEIAIIQPTQLGFYLLRLDELKTSDWPAAPTACGIAISGYVGPKKLKVRGQVVVPIELAGPTAVQLLTTVVF
jgi:hypothetical protein